MTEIPRTNWAKSYRYAFRDGLQPSSIEELRAAVASTPRVKVIGSCHSFNAIADGEVALVLDRLPPDPRIEADGRQVSIAGHATYGELAAFLGAHGLAVHNLASLPHISIAGAIATATHGSGIGNGNLATAVSALDLVTADGSLMTVRRGDADFDGMVVHLGMLGVIARVTLDVRPTFEVAQTVYEGVDWPALLGNVGEILSAGYSVSIFTRWSDEGSHVWLKRIAPFEDLPELFHGAPRSKLKRHPIIDLDPVNATDQLSIPGTWSDRLPHFRMGFTPSNGDEIQSEYHVPIVDAADAIESLCRIRHRFAPLVQTTEFRAVAADRLWMSPQYRRDTLSLHFTWSPDADAVDKAVRHVEAALAPYDPRPHWGKVFAPDFVGKRYPMLDRFKALRERLDPTGKFLNPWLSQVVLGKTGGD
jgi:alditol oxidase